MNQNIKITDAIVCNLIIWIYTKNTRLFRDTVHVLLIYCTCTHPPFPCVVVVGTTTHVSRRIHSASNPKWWLGQNVVNPPEIRQSQYAHGTVVECQSNFFWNWIWNAQVLYAVSMLPLITTQLWSYSKPGRTTVITGWGTTWV